MAMRFIRKNGRVIPIREHQGASAGGSSSPQPRAGTTSPSGKAQPSVAGGAVLVGAGAAIAHGAGHAGGMLVRSAAGYEWKARNLISTMGVAKALGKDKVAQDARRLFKANVKMRTLHWRAGLNVRHAGYAAGGALIGLGTNDLLKNVPGFKGHDAARVAVAGGVGVGTHFIVRHAFERYMQRPRGLKQGIKVMRDAALFTLSGFGRKFK